MDAIGTIELSESSEVIFYVDDYKGNEWANIRKFIKSKKYTGPTKSGIKLDKKHLEIIFNVVKEIPRDLETFEEKELVKIPLSDNWFILVQISFFNGQYGLDIRQHLNTEKYKGPSKKGVRIPIDYLEETTCYFEKMLRIIGNLKKKEILDEKKQVVNNEKVLGRNKKNIEGVPDEYQKYF